MSGETSVISASKIRPGVISVFHIKSVYMCVENVMRFAAEQQRMVALGASPGDLTGEEVDAAEQRRTFVHLAIYVAAPQRIAGGPHISGFTR